MSGRQENVARQYLGLTADHYAGSLDNISQFAYIPGPVVPAQSFERFRTQGHTWTELRQKGFGELFDVFQALAQRR
jgi:hypothetical protein